MTEPIRIQKWLSQQGVMSRRAAETAITQRRIKKNGELATLGDKVTAGDTLTLDGEVVSSKKQTKVVYAFHKPKGMQSTLRYFPQKTTLANVRFPQRLFPVGRLDKDSHGLLLMTNDGELANRIMHPRYVHEKEYIVELNEPLTGSEILSMKKGIMLKGELKRTAPCEIKHKKDNAYTFILKEGRNRQIRRMCEHFDKTVIDLFRVRIGTVELNRLPARNFVMLKGADLSKIYAFVGLKADN